MGRLQWTEWEALVKACSSDVDEYDKEIKKLWEFVRPHSLATTLFQPCSPACTFVLACLHVCPSLASTLSANPQNRPPQVSRGVSSSLNEQLLTDDKMQGRMHELQSHFADDLTNEAEWILKYLVGDEKHKALSKSEEEDVQAAIAEIIKLLRFDMLEVPFIMRYRKGVLERARIPPQRVWDVLEKVSRAAQYRVQHGIACGTVQDKEWLDLQGRKNTLQNLWIPHVFHSTKKVSINPTPPTQHRLTEQDHLSLPTHHPRNICPWRDQAQ